MNYEELIEKIKNNTELIIEAKHYKVLSKTFYITKNDTEHAYVKCKLSENKVLVIIPIDKMMYLGEINNHLEIITLDSNTIEYNSKVYHKVTEDYQLVKKIDFGIDTDIEKECAFIDYESEDNTSIISFGTLENNIQADIIGTIFDISKIELL